jgi:hypothetical protein
MGLDEETWKTIIYVIFVFLTTSALIAVFDYAPIGLFAEPSVEYSVNITERNFSDEKINATIQTDRQFGTDDFNTGGVGIIIGGIMIAVFCSLSYTLDVAYSPVRGVSLIYTLDVDSSPARGVIATIVATVCVVIVFIGGGASTDSASGFGLVLYVILIGLLSYEASIPLNSDLKLEFNYANRYLQKRARFAQASLSVGLAIAIGGALTYASQAGSRPIETGVLVGVFFFPMAGISAIEYYRIHRIESQNRPTHESTEETKNPGQKRRPKAASATASVTASVTATAS